MRLLDNEQSNNKLIEAIEFLKLNTDGSKDMGARLFVLLSKTSDEMVKQFIDQMNPPNKYTPMHDLQICDAVRTIHQFAKEHENVKIYLEELGKQRGKAKAELTFVQKESTKKSSETQDGCLLM